MKRARALEGAPRRAWLAACLASALAGLSAPARANGRFPAAGQIAVHPGDSSRLVVRATYGLLASDDGGKTFGWVCEEAVGFSGTDDPAIGVTSDGTWLAGLFDGLRTSRDGGCSWSGGGPLEQRYVVDLSVEREDPSRVVAITSNGLSPDVFEGKLWESTDAGTSFAQSGTDLPPEFLALNVDVAPSRPARIYVSGRLGKPDYLSAIVRSDDRGETWEVSPIPADLSPGIAYLSAVDPSDPARLYLRVDGEGKDVLLVSDDAGASFRVAFEAEDLLGFALSPDGGRVAVGGKRSGLWVASAEALDFERRAPLRVECLAWSKTGLFACASEVEDGFTVGVSTDEGASFRPLLRRTELCGARSCPAGSPVDLECSPRFPEVARLVGAHPCVIAKPGPGASPPAAPPAEASGCALAAPRFGAAAAISLALGALALTRRGRRGGR